MTVDADAKRDEPTCDVMTVEESLAHMSDLDLIIMRSETKKAGVAEDKDKRFLAELDSELRRRGRQHGI